MYYFPPPPILDAMTFLRPILMLDPRILSLSPHQDPKRIADHNHFFPSPLQLGGEIPVERGTTLTRWLFASPSSSLVIKSLGVRGDLRLVSPSPFPAWEGAGVP